MPADKDAAKRRRQARNRQERQNRQARTDGAKRAAARPSRTVEETPTRSGAKTGAKGGARTGSKTDLTKAPARPQPATGGVLGKLFPPRPEPADGEGAEARPARPTRPPSHVVEVEDVPGVRGLILRLTAQPGGRATVLALLVSVVAAATLIVFPVWPSSDLTGYGETVVRSQLDAQGVDEDEIDDAVREVQTTSLEQVRGFDFGPPQIFLVLLIAGLPIIISFFAVRSLLRPTRSRTLMWCSIAGVAVIILNPVTGLYFLLGVLALGFAAYQSAKADKAALAASS